MTDSRAPAVWVVTPTYNEAANVETMVRRLLAVFDRSRLDGRVLVVDDGSPDGTGRIADRVAAEDGRVHVLHRKEKTGLAAAYVAGFAHALECGADLIVEMDCDLSHAPEQLPSLVAAATRADLVLGSRYVPGGRIEGWGLMRKIVSQGGCFYARTLLGVPVRDLTGGFKCFRRHVLEAIDLASVSASGYGFQIELTYRAIQSGFRVTEVPIVFRDREHGRSKMSPQIALEAALLVPGLRGNAPSRAGRPGKPVGVIASRAASRGR